MKSPEHIGGRTLGRNLGHMRQPMPARQRAADAATLWAELRQATQDRYHELLAADAQRRPLALRRLLLALELRWKLEELVLLPALQAQDDSLRLDLQSIARENDLLRELTELVAEGSLPASAENTLFGVLEGIASLRAERLEILLANPAQLDRVRGLELGRDMLALLDRWREEVATTGDIEDEEADPVGKAPR